MDKTGFLAYGSLLDDPGEELSPFIQKSISCTTPFKVEYARKSRTRGNALKLIPSKKFAKEVKAKILILNGNLNINNIKSILWSRETGLVDKAKEYKHSVSPSKNKVQVEIIENFYNIQKVLFTSIGRNIEEKISATKLAHLAIKSILSEAGLKRKMDCDILLSNNMNGITTEFSSDYMREILRKTNSTTLEEAIDKLDEQRETMVSI